MARRKLHEVGRGFGERGDGPDADVFALEELEPLGERAGPEDRRELARECLLVGVELPLRQLRSAEQPRQAAEERRLERGEGEMASVRGLVDAVAGEAAGQHARQGLAAEPVRDEPVRAVCHRDDDVAAPAGPFALEQCGEDLRHGAERACGEVCDLEGRQRGRRVPERAGPAEVIEVVTCALLMAAAEAEAGDRAVDGAFQCMLRADAEAGRDARTERLEHDVRLAQELERRRSVALQVDLERLLPRAQRVVRGGGGAAHRIAAGRLDADDPRPELQQLARREGAGEVTTEIDHQHPAQRLHSGPNVALLLKPVRSGRRRSGEREKGEPMHRLVLAALAAASATALLAVAAALAAPPGKNHYVVTPLASDVPGLAPATDANLKNTWGLARGDTTPWWIANNGTASTSVYNGAGTRVDIGGLPAQGVPGDPTGAVFSGIAGQFQVGTTASPTTLGPSNFIFDGEDGAISAWRIGSTAALVTVPASGAVFKGLAISNGPSGPRLYATDFANKGSVDVFDGSWNQVNTPGAFVDPRLPRHFAPFGIQTIGDRVFVTYGKQQPG